MTTLATFTDRLNSLVKGDQLPLGATDREIAVEIAAREHARYRPRVIVKKFSGDGGFDYAIATNLTLWEKGVSAILEVEYPVDDDDETRDMLEREAWVIFRTEDSSVDYVEYLRFLEDTPAATDEIRVTYTTKHTIDESESTILGHDEEAVAQLAAAHLCGMLSAYMAAQQESTMDADTADHGRKTDNYAAREKMYRGLYFRHLGVAEGKAPPACITRDWDWKGSWAGERLTHRRKYR